MTLAKQFSVLLRMSLGGIPARPGLAFTIVISVTCAVGVLVAMLAMVVGARREAMGNVRPDRVLLISADAQSPVQSRILAETVPLIRGLPGLKRNARGEPIVVLEALGAVRARYRSDGHPTSYVVHGVTPGLTDYLVDLHLTSGRLFRPGLHELIATSSCAAQFEDMGLGDKKHMLGGEWVVVGIFDYGRTAGNCALYADGATMLSAFGRNAYNEADVMLESAGAFSTLAGALKADPSLRLKAWREEELVASFTQQLIGMLKFVSYFVGTIIAVAATMGAANSLYAIVDGRRRELATLRALGFNASPIVASILSESILLAMPGALLGTLIAWVGFDGLVARGPLGSTFPLVVTPQLALLGVGWALSIGAIGGLLPAVKAARASVTTGLRAT